MTIQKHVFVETNFLVDLLRPLKTPEAEELLERHGNDLYLYMPWCCQSEAARTLERVSAADLSFGDPMVKFALLQYKASDPRKMEPIQELKREADKRKRNLKNTPFQQLISEACQKLNVIQPSQQIFEKTTEVFKQKSLNPFDEMVLSTVLVTAQQMKTKDPLSQIYFATLDSDLADVNIQAMYDSLGIRHQKHFRIP